MSKLSIKAAAIAVALGGAIVGASTASAALALPTMNCSYVFNTNMKMGSKGVQVMNLQKVLNMYPQTRVAESGAGSPGMETSKFGPATRAAVNKFQMLQLAELGINSPTGNVFAGTRGLLNQLCSVTGNPVPTPGNPVPPTGNTGPVSVMLSGSQPTGQLVQGQSGARLADFTFKGNGTVTNIELQRIGVSTDSTLNNVYLYDGNTRLTDAASVVTGGYIRFNAGTGLFSVSGTRTITVRADLSSTSGGNAVGVKLNSVTAMGSAASTFTNVMGNTLTVASGITTASVNFNPLVTGARTVDAGTTNYNVWDATASVGVRDVYFKAATFKFVGSAPVDSVANLSLYVDGTKVAGPAMINAMNNNKVVFDLGTMPYFLRTGSHTINVRGDIVKGSNRTMTFSVENVADLMFEDRDLTGVNVAATVATLPLNSSNSAYPQITVNKGTVVVNVDPAFVASKVTGGATNMTIGSFTMKAYGEDVKVNTLNVTPVLGSMTPAAAGLTNVGLYLNGGQISSSQNWSSGALTYNLGSSLIIPAGQTVTVSVKADIKSTTSVSYTAGSVLAQLSSAGNNAQGQSSSEIVSVASSGVNGNNLTVSSGVGSYGRTSGFAAATVAPNTANVRIGSFTLQADSAEDAVVNSATVTLSTTGYPLTNITNLSLKTGSMTLGTPVGNVSASSTVISFSDVVVPMNGTKTFDVYADIGSVTSGTVTATLDLSTRGPVSGTNTTVSGTGLGVAITTTAATLGLPAIVSSSPVSQFVVGGVSSNVATYKIKTAQDSAATVRELRFSITGNDSVESVTVNGVQASVVGGIAKVTGLSIAIGLNGTDVPVTVKYSGFKNSSTGGSLTAGVISTTTLTYIEATSGNGTTVSTTTAISANAMTLVASKPSVTVDTVQKSGLILGAENKIGEVTVVPDANGSINVNQLKFSSGASGLSGALTLASARLADGSATIPNVTCTIASTVTTCSFSTAYSLSAGSSKTFSLYAVPTGTVVSGATVSVSTQVTNTANDFQWTDVVGGNTTYDGVKIYNFPTASYSIKN